MRKGKASKRSMISSLDRGPANACSNPCRINPVVTMRSPRSIALRNCATADVSGLESRPNPSDQTLVSTKNVTGVNARP